MAIRKQMCVNHADRSAIGVCVITGTPICAECSTRYEGVNYSKEGLRILQQRRAAQARGVGRRLGVKAALVLTTPLLCYLVYLFYAWNLVALIDLQQRSFLE